MAHPLAVSTLDGWLWSLIVTLFDHKSFQLAQKSNAVRAVMTNFPYTQSFRATSPEQSVRSWTRCSLS